MLNHCKEARVMTEGYDKLTIIYMIHASMLHETILVIYVFPSNLNSLIFCHEISLSVGFILVVVFLCRLQFYLLIFMVSLTT